MIRLAVLALALAACKKSTPATTTTPPPPGGGGGSTTDTAPTTGGGGTTTTNRTTTPAAGGEEACPSIQMKAPDSVPQGSKARVTANLIGGAARPTFNWTLAAGTIVSGQGTATIQVDTTGLAGSGITATVDLGQLPRECATTSASVTFLVGP
jgi:hypothetical protein